MAENPPTLTVIVSPTAVQELWEIWQYNAHRYSFDHAQEYEAFLAAGIGNLATTYREGRDVEGFPELKSVTLKRSRKGDGHIVIYEIDETEQTVAVLHIFHTKMDVEGRLESERP
jgi:plasmid stabilization system protein ParE